MSMSVRNGAPPGKEQSDRSFIGPCVPDSKMDSRNTELISGRASTNTIHEGLTPQFTDQPEKKTTNVARRENSTIDGLQETFDDVIADVHRDRNSQTDADVFHSRGDTEAPTRAYKDTTTRPSVPVVIPSAASPRLGNTTQEEHRGPTDSREELTVTSISSCGSDWKLLNSSDQDADFNPPRLASGRIRQDPGRRTTAKRRTLGSFSRTRHSSQQNTRNSGRDSTSSSDNAIFQDSRMTISDDGSGTQRDDAIEVVEDIKIPVVADPAVRIEDNTQDSPEYSEIPDVSRIHVPTEPVATVDPWVRSNNEVATGGTTVRFIDANQHPTSAYPPDHITEHQRAPHTPQNYSANYAGNTRPARRSDSQEELDQIASNRSRMRTTSSGPNADESELRERIRNDMELLTRPSWCDARFALSRLDQDKATGNRYALKLRSFLHRVLFKFGCFIQRNAAYVLIIGILALAGCCICLKFAHMETDISKLWVETGGKLEDELKYTASQSSSGSESSGFTLQMMMQAGEDITDLDSLKLHLDAAIAATKVTVVMYNQTWSFNDVCYKQAIPGDEDSSGSFILSTLERVFPCFIIGPLDCFWEGSKLLGPTPPIYLGPTMSDITWKSMNPLGLINTFREALSESSIAPELNEYYELMLQAGITNGYTDRWCLDPMDDECPETAPNYHSKELPDVKSILKAGCSGFATKVMQWPLDLIVGGIKYNGTGAIDSAQGLQTLFQLMGSTNMYNFHNSIKGGPTWSLQKAEAVLLAWQRKFADTLFAIKSKKVEDKIYAFTGATATDILNEFSNMSTMRVVGGYLLMIGYACLSLMRSKASRSQGLVGILGVVLVALSVAGGLGICSAIGISFNAASTQVLPFLMLGLGVDDMFLMAHHFGEIAVLSYIPFSERTGECLKRVGVSVCLTSVAILSGFLFSLIIPMPALRAFGLQAAVVTVFNLFSVLVIFPSILSLDLQRRRNNKLDIFFCFDSKGVNDVVDISAQSNAARHQQQCPAHHPPVYNCSPLPGSTLPVVEGTEATITMHHTVQAYSNRSFVTVLGPVTETAVATDPPAPSTGTPPYTETPRTPPPQYTSKVDETLSQKVTPISNRPRVAFVNTNESSVPYTTRTPVGQRSAYSVTPVSGRTSRRSNGSNPPTNLTTPMESVRSSTHSLVPNRRRRANSGFLCWPNRAVRSGSVYACLATLPSLTLSQLGERYYAPFLLRNPVRITVLVLFAGILGVSIYGTTVVKDGLDLGDVLPRGTREHDAIVVQTTYFSFFNMYVVTKNFDYASQQQNLFDLHSKVGNISYVMRQTDGTVTKFWLQYMRDWLLDLQDNFDEAWRLGHVNASTWMAQASDKTVLAYKLLLQTGRAEEPTDPGRIGCPNNMVSCDRVGRIRLVSDDGLIPEDAFYNYLSAWVGNDPLSYAAAQASITPAPVSWKHKRDLNMIIPRSQSLTFAQMPFYLNGLQENEDFVSVIKSVRSVCETMAATTEVSSYPSGYPFTFWQQYIDLRYWLFVSLGCVIAAVFVVLSIVLFNPWAAAIMALFLAMIATELLGFMGAAGVKLSAVPAVILVASIGLGVEFTVHITFAFITSCGSRKERVVHSIGHMTGPVVDGAVSTLLGVVMLAGSEFDFIIKYFFQVLGILILLGVLNGLVLLPVVLSFIGPPPEVTPIGGGGRLKTPTPPPSPPPVEPECRCHFRSRYRNSNNSSNYRCHSHRCCQHYQHYNHGLQRTCSHRSGVQVRRECGPGCRPAPYRGGPTHDPQWHGSCRSTTMRSSIRQTHPHAVPQSSRYEDHGRTYVYPRGEYVVYSTGNTPPNEQAHEYHCETEPSTRLSFQPIHTPSNEGATFKGKSSNSVGGVPNVAEGPIATVSTTSSVTVKFPSTRRQRVVAFVEPAPSSSSSSSYDQPPDNLPHPDLDMMMSSTSDRIQPLRTHRRRFDISALDDVTAPR
uniref:protein patched homolog 1 isoform X1 n=1 Tax=Ciona intestinalis TaxID=7719 RepID=UPI00089DC650|nr:protein patched homolog 1 isoform X1 [Ciona intestinalis]|eukprot:XP_009858682.2 protein patched homolog 1 isoform X1 [Ciona intestinalis]